MRNSIIVKKILTYIEKILTYCSGVNYDDFCTNTMLVEACVFNLSQIGEVVKHLESWYKDKHPNVPWQEMYGLRCRIVHDYAGVNLNLIWQIINEDLPELKEQLDGLQ